MTKENLAKCVSVSVSVRKCTFCNSDLFRLPLQSPSYLQQLRYLHLRSLPHSTFLLQVSLISYSRRLPHVTSRIFMSIYCDQILKIYFFRCAKKHVSLKNPSDLNSCQLSTFSNLYQNLENMTRVHKYYPAITIQACRKNDQTSQ